MTSPLQTAARADAVPIELVGSMSEFVTGFLDLTPRVRDPVRQQALTDRFLTPALEAIDALMRELRASVDPVLASAVPAQTYKAYPLGRCLEITRGVEQRLTSLEPVALSVRARQGWSALAAFREAGGEVRRAWGDLRGQYFQNAFVVGSLYVDVSNDTVVATKPPVEILPFAAAGFSPIADYAHFVRIAGRYWGYRFLRNHLLPDLAPYWPLLQIKPDGRLSLGPLNGYLLALSVRGRLEPSVQALRGPVAPPQAFAPLRAALAGAPWRLAASAEAGRDAALANCRAWGEAEGDDAVATFNRTMLAGGEANRYLTSLGPLARAA